MIRSLFLAVASLAAIVAIAPASRAAWPLFPNQPGVDVFFPGLGSFGQPNPAPTAPIIYQPPGSPQPYIIAPLPDSNQSVIYQQRTFFPRVYVPSGFAQPLVYPFPYPYPYPCYGLPRPCR